MTPAQVAAQVLLWVGAGAELLCCAGVWWLQDVFAKLHYAAAAASVGPVLIGASVAVTGAGSLAGTVEAVTAAAVLLLVSPVTTHAIGRAARRLLHDDIGPDPRELGGS